MQNRVSYEKQMRLKAVEVEMKRLQERIDAWRAAVKAIPETHPRESGAIRRASMDLTRALAAYRKGDRS